MFPPHSPLPGSVPLAGALRAFAVLGLVLTIATCRDALGPRSTALGRVAVAPVFPSEAALAEFGLTIDRVRFIVVRPPADTIADTTLALPPDATELALDLRVSLIAAAETLSVSVVALSGTVSLFAGTSLVPVPSPLPPTVIPLDSYVGPGTGVDSIVIQPRAPFIYLNDSLRFQVEAFQAGVPVTQFYVSWSTSDTTVARVNGFGVLRAPATRTAVRVRARTPSGVRDSVLVTFVPLPTRLIAVAGAGQTGSVGQALETPLEVEVRAADNLPVGGVSVRFRSLSGGAPADTAVASDAAGRARVIGVLGATAGAQSFEASLPAFPAVPAVPFGANATAGAVASVVVTPGSALLDALGATQQFTAEAFDANGNPVAATFAWATSDQLVGTVDSTGLAIGVGNGTADITATTTGVQGVATLTVSQLATTLRFKVQPGAVAAGDTITPPVEVEAVDALGTVVPAFTDPVAIALGNNPGNGTLRGTSPVNAVLGVATFADLTIDKVGSGYTLVAAASGATSATSTAFNVNPGPATSLVFVQQPPATVFFGDTFAVQVAALDDLGNVVTSFSGNVLLSENPGSTDSLAKLQGTLVQPAVNGVATFADLSVDGTDTTAIDAMADPLTPATSSVIAVVDQIVLKEGDGIRAGAYFAGVDTVTNRVYVSNSLGSSASIVEAALHKVANVVAVGPNPGWEGVNPVTQRVFISDFVEGTVYVIDESVEKVEAVIPVGANATQPAVDPAADVIYVPARPDVLSLMTVDVRTRAVVGAVPIGGTGDNAGGAVWDPVSKLVWVVIESQGSVKSVDPAGGQVVDSFFVGEAPYGIALDPKLNQLYVTLSGQSQVWVLGLTDKRPLPAIGVGVTPQGLSVDAETGRVFVANYDDGIKPGTLSVIDGAQGIVIKTITVGVGPGDAEYNPRNRLVYVPNGTEHSLSIVKP